MFIREFENSLDLQVLEETEQLGAVLDAQFPEDIGYGFLPCSIQSQ